MEQKKVLWIVAALGIFLLVIFLGTLIIYSPSQTEMVPTTIDGGNNMWINPQAIELKTPINQNPADKNLENPVQDSLIQSGDLTVISKGTTTVVAQEGVTTIDLTKLTGKESEVKDIEPAVRPVETRLPPATASTPKKDQPKTEVATTKAEPTQATTPAKPLDQYWVQAASFVSKANADNARTALIKQKIPAEVFTHSGNDGVTYYRVRVGPYTTKSEAEYWDSLIKTVDSFADSKTYITNTAKPS